MAKVQIVSRKHAHMTSVETSEGVYAYPERPRGKGSSLILAGVVLIILALALAAFAYLFIGGVPGLIAAGIVCLAGFIMLVGGIITTATASR